MSGLSFAEFPGRRFYEAFWDESEQVRGYRSIMDFNGNGHPLADHEMFAVRIGDGATPAETAFAHDIVHGRPPFDGHVIIQAEDAEFVVGRYRGRLDQFNMQKRKSR